MVPTCVRTNTNLGLISEIGFGLCTPSASMIFGISGIPFRFLRNSACMPTTFCSHINFCININEVPSTFLHKKLYSPLRFSCLLPKILSPPNNVQKSFLFVLCGPSYATSQIICFSFDTPPIAITHRAKYALVLIFLFLRTYPTE